MVTVKSMCLALLRALLHLSLTWLELFNKAR